MEPTPADIAQWTWTSIGSGADRVIFWLLNARREGVEAGERSLLDFQQQPSARLTIATERATPAGGRVIWIPSPVGLGAWLSDAQPLAEFLQKTFSSTLQPLPFSLGSPQKGCLLRTLVNKGQFLTVVTNATAAPLPCTVHTSAKLSSETLWGVPPQAGDHQSVLQLPARGTSVQLWR